MIRTWGIQTLSGAAQGLFQDALAAPVSGIKSSSGLYTVTVATNSKYRQGDRIILGYGTGTTSTLLINGFGSSNLIYCASEGDAPVPRFASSAAIALSISCMGISVQGIDGNAGDIWLGGDMTVTNTGGGFSFRKLVKVSAGSQPSVYDLLAHNSQNGLRSTDMTIAGTASDKFMASMIVN